MRVGMRKKLGFEDEEQDDDESNKQLRKALDKALDSDPESSEPEDEAPQQKLEPSTGDVSAKNCALHRWMRGRNN